MSCTFYVHTIPYFLHILNVVFYVQNLDITVAQGFIWQCRDLVFLIMGISIRAISQ